MLEDSITLLDPEALLSEQMAAEADVSDTEPMAAVFARAVTSNDWPPEPPAPCDLDLAQGTLERWPSRDPDAACDLDLAQGTLDRGEPVRGYRADDDLAQGSLTTKPVGRHATSDFAQGSVTNARPVRVRRNASIFPIVRLPTED
jgi:hypothetical protein